MKMSCLLYIPGPGVIKLFSSSNQLSMTEICPANKSQITNKCKFFLANMKKKSEILSEFFQFLVLKFSVYLNKFVFVMDSVLYVED